MSHVEPPSHYTTTQEYQVLVGLQTEEAKTNEIKRRKHLSNPERLELLNYLLQHVKEGNAKKLQYGVLTKATTLFNISKRSLQDFWSTVQKQLQMGIPVEYKHKMTGNVGRKKVEIDYAKMKQIPLRRRQSVRSLAYAMDLSKSTMHRATQTSNIRRHSTAPKPLLNDDNKLLRLNFCLEQLEPASIPLNPTFKYFQNVIHIDEKWFYMTKEGSRYYMLTEEEDPHRECQSKRFITKVMFLCAIARPIFGEAHDVLFDGKIGIFPFTQMEKAKRKSKNRDAGALEQKPIYSVTKNIIKEFILLKLIPALKERWPTSATKDIVIQQDNAKPHISPQDPDFVTAATSDGWNIKLTCQPPNSPDLNILDVGFFRAIQSLQYQAAPKTVDELVEAVKDAYLKLKPQTVNTIWLSYQYVMEAILKVQGSNKYKLPHVGKERLEREGMLPTSVSIDPMLYANTVAYLSQVTEENQI